MTSRFTNLTAAQTHILLWAICQHNLKNYNNLLDFFDSAQAALNAGVTDWQQAGLKKTALERYEQFTKEPSKWLTALDKINTNLAQQHFSVVFEHEVHYPQLLKQIADPPPVLFYKGNASLFNSPSIAIVGTRQPTHFGKELTQQFAQQLSQAGLCVVSGLAHGVDREAHIGALKAINGKTIAVLGTGINTCYPSANTDVFEHILDQQGLIISEFLPNAPALQYHFPRRNRIVSGLSLGVLITEAALDSGSLITAKLAAEQGRQIFAVPGSINNPQAEGCHHLIREGATLVYHPQHILDDLSQNQTFKPTQSQQTLQSLTFKAPESKEEQGHWSNQPNHKSTIQPDISNQKVTSKTNKASKKTPKAIITTRLQTDNTVQIEQHLSALYNALDWQPRDIDYIVEQSQLPVAQVLGQLTELELLGLITCSNGKYHRC